MNLPTAVIEWLTRMGDVLGVKTPTPTEPDLGESSSIPYIPLPPGTEWTPTPKPVPSILEQPPKTDGPPADSPVSSDGSVSPKGMEQLKSTVLEPPSSGPPPMLRKDDTGSDGWIEYLQELLNKHLGSGAVPMSGQFDQPTFDAVIRFQQSAGCSVDGIVGNQSWRALRATATPPDGGGAKTNETTGTDETVKTGDTETAEDGPPDLPPPVDSNLSTTRTRIIQIAESMVGKVSDVGGEGGMKKGWQHLKEFYDTALGEDSAKKGWLKGIQTPGLRAGSTAQNKSGISWCGIFATWAVINAGVPGVKWVLGTAIKGLPQPKGDQNYQPGDILVLKGKQVHHCVLKAKNGSSLTTIDGNVMNQGIEVRSRNTGEVWYYYQTVAD